MLGRVGGTEVLYRNRGLLGKVENGRIEYGITDIWPRKDILLIAKITSGASQYRRMRY